MVFRNGINTLGCETTALTRLVARRGWPRDILSDNSTNFVGGDRELKELV